MEPKQLFLDIVQYHKDEKSSEEVLSLIELAYAKAEKAYEKTDSLDQKSFVQVLQSAKILSGMYLNADMIVICILQDVFLEKEIDEKEIEKDFGIEIVELGSHLVQLLQIRFIASNDAQQHETMRRMLISFSKDIRVIFIAFANMLRDMRNLNSFPYLQRIEIAEQVMHISVPLADRLGIWQFKTLLEDLAFRYLYRKEYEILKKNVEIVMEKTPDYIEKMEKSIHDIFQKNNFESQKVSGRVKNLYSIFKKMKYKNKTFEEIHDIFAIRVIVNSVSDCYEALGIIHSQWKPFAHRIKDYIAIPKPNGYQSLHTTVRGIDGRPTEIQIRTNQMHEDAEFGLAAHFVYGAKKASILPTEEEQNWLEKIKVIQSEMEEENIDNISLELFNDRIFVFTPNGDVHELPQGACSIDFAYAIHSDVGQACVGGKINGKMQSLYTEIKNGDTVEILTSKNPPGPNHEWLQHVVTSKAKTKIRTHLKQGNKEENAKKGLEILTLELQKIQQKFTKELQKKSLEKLPYDSVEDIYVAIGEGSVPVSHVMEKMFDDSSIFRKPKEAIVKVKEENIKGIIIEDGVHMDYELAQCCTPEAPNHILAYISMASKVKIHDISCKQVPLMDLNRILSAHWDDTTLQKATYSIIVRIIFAAENSIIQAVIQSFSDKGYPIDNVNSFTTEHNNYLDIKTKVLNYSELRSIFSFLEKIKGVKRVEVLNV